MLKNFYKSRSKKLVKSYIRLISQKKLCEIWIFSYSILQKLKVFPSKHGKVRDIRFISLHKLFGLDSLHFSYIQCICCKKECIQAKKSKQNSAKVNKQLFVQYYKSIAQTYVFLAITFFLVCHHSFFNHLRDFHS